ncbi:hypothetical protein POM88_031829 [Heracleum sosnowskyi]|uniref:Uncharacterized protein n=1 Tax=Heracleum sosnowskyi TaxID=360622 RepID=A0AAD8HYG3_9APIA|nr:hypothetical protein POM88_031829 [Heracleum sosnowskyi]
MELDQEGVGQPNVVTNTRSVDFDDDDDFATPQPMTKRSAPILIIGTSTAAKETITKTKRRLNVEESDEGQLGDVDAKERNKKKTKTTKEPNEDKWDGKVGKARKVNMTEKFKIRNSPNTLTFMVRNLYDEQKQWVISTGFKHILDFRLGKIPHRLACSVLEAFDAETCSLKLQGEIISITDQDVYNVLGLPNGDKIFTLATEDKDLERHNCGKNNITTAAVAEKIKESQEADDQFKLKFFLIFYVDRVIFKGLTPVERKFPAFKNWTMELLKQRQKYEKQCGNFEENLVIRHQAEIDQIMKDDHGVKESNTSHEDHQNNARQENNVIREKWSSEEYLIDPVELDHFELIEYLYSSQGKKDMEMDMQELLVPSFSLGTDLQNSVIDICKDISREHGDDTIV